MALADTRSSYLWSTLPGNFDRLNTRALFASANRWGIPDLPAATFEPSRLIAYNDRRGCETAAPGAAVHFFLDDYRFESVMTDALAGNGPVWRKPQRPLSRLQRVGAALTPDFSLWRDMPIAMQEWQTYRNRWCGMWMAEHGITVVPTVSWSTEDSYAFAFAGIAPGSVVAVSTVGVRARDARELFAQGYAAMVEAIRPTLVLVYGHALDELADRPVRYYPTRWTQQKAAARAAANEGG